VPGRSLDFIIIGAQKAGTTTLWQHLYRHPLIWMPGKKEEPFFCTPEATVPNALDQFMESHFGHSPKMALLGKATPHYMMGSEGAGVEQIADRIAAALPNIRLIALLRDPIERAASQYRMSVRRGWEQRTFEQAIVDLLDNQEIGRQRANETNSYVAQGEYGRILGVYSDRFPAAQLHVELTESLAGGPGELLDRILHFLSLPPGYRPPRLDARLHRGGSQNLLDRESRDSLREFLDENVWPRLGDEADQVKSQFQAFLAIWDIAPEDEMPELSPRTRARLEAHYEADGAELERLGIAAPWIEHWQDQR
jgi:hypothetical protein